ncbi:MAG: hypothetical protein JO072_16250 [Parafilimonas sp.]|nr:hypothetical protein [Parafilimonas sp.]
MIFFADIQNADIVKELIKDNFINAMSLRFTLVFLIVLLVKILLAWCKYSIKMMNFYDSRRIAINLSGTQDLDRVKTFSEIYSTDKIDFIIEELGSNGFIEIMKSVAGRWR